MKKFQYKLLLITSLTTIHISTYTMFTATKRISTVKPSFYRTMPIRTAVSYQQTTQPQTVGTTRLYSSQPYKTNFYQEIPNIEKPGILARFRQWMKGKNENEIINEVKNNASQAAESLWDFLKTKDIKESLLLLDKLTLFPRSDNGISVLNDITFRLQIQNTPNPIILEKLIIWTKYRLLMLFRQPSTPVTGGGFTMTSTDLADETEQFLLRLMRLDHKEELISAITENLKDISQTDIGISMLSFLASFSEKNFISLKITSEQDKKLWNRIVAVISNNYQTFYPILHATREGQRVLSIINKQKYREQTIKE